MRNPPVAAFLVDICIRVPCTELSQGKHWFGVAGYEPSSWCRLQNLAQAGTIPATRRSNEQDNRRALRSACKLLRCRTVPITFARVLAGFTTAWSADRPCAHLQR